MTAAAGTLLTVTRGVDSTAGATHSAGAAVKHAVSARDFREPQEHMADAAIHVPAVTDLLPAGLGPLPWAGSSAPTGWLLCDGSEVSRSTYANLFAVVGTIHGAGDGSTTFNLPDMQGMVPVGHDPAQTEFDTIGATGGEKTHALTQAELAAHAHTTNHDHAAVSSGGQSAGHTHSGTTSTTGDHAHALGISDAGGLGGGGSLVRKGGVPGDNSGGGGSHAHTMTTGVGSSDHTHTVDVPAYVGNSGSVGSGDGHNNLQPYRVFHYIIKH